MSTESWYEEHYPIAAADVADKDAGAMVERKWTGLQKQKLEEHGLRKVEGNITIVGKNDDGYPAEIQVGINSCPWCIIDSRERREHSRLCKTGFVVDDDHSQMSCGFCPAVQAGLLSCIDDSDGHRNAPYYHWMETGDTRRILGWIKRARNAIAAKGAESNVSDSVE